MARIAGVDLPREKRVQVGLTYVYGIGQTTANKILEATGINPDTRVKDLTLEEEAKIRDYRHIAFKVCTAVLVKGFAGTKQSHKSFLNKVIVFITLCRKLSCNYADSVKISYDKLIKSTVITKTHKICKLCVG